jgi:hypothetical protein
MPCRNVKNKPSMPKEGLENKGDAGEGLPKKVKKGKKDARRRRCSSSSSQVASKGWCNSPCSSGKGEGLCKESWDQGWWNCVSGECGQITGTSYCVCGGTGGGGCRCRCHCSSREAKLWCSGGCLCGRDLWWSTYSGGGGLRGVTQRKKGQRKEGPKLLLLRQLTVGRRHLPRCIIQLGRHLPVLGRIQWEVQWV